MSEMTYTEALRAAIREEMERDPRVFLIGEDIAAYGGAFGVSRGLVDFFGPARIRNTPISEPGFVGAAIGAAMVGSRPIVEIMFMDFMGLTSDQLVNQAAKLHYVFGEQARCPLVVRTAAGAGRCYGPTHSQNFEAWFFSIPGIKIAVPSTPADAKGLLKTAIRDDNPVLFIEHKMLYGRRGEVPDDPDFTIPFGRTCRVEEGEDLTIVAWSWMAALAEQAVGDLERCGLYAELFDLRTLAPLDLEGIVESARKTGRVLIVDEGCRTGGVSAEIACRISEQAYEYLARPPRRLTSLDVPISATPTLEQARMPSRDSIVEAAIALCE